MKKKNLAFTLAEVLIVIGIIGVVAALTLPNLNHTTGDKETVTRVKKIYSSLSDAFDRAEVVYGDFDTWFTDLDIYNTNGAESIKAAERIAKRITEFLKVSKDCGAGDGCYPTKIKGFDGDDNPYYKGQFNYVLSDGTALSFRYPSIEGTPEYTRASIFIDINGTQKGPNRTGYDMFEVVCINGMMLPSDNPAYVDGTNCNYYTNWILTNENLDYLKIDDEGQCNDSNIILDGVTNTSCH